MVGRIIVGEATGPGSKPFDYYVGRAKAEDWLPVPAAARSAFPSIARVMKEHTVHHVP